MIKHQSLYHSTYPDSYEYPRCVCQQLLELGAVAARTRSEACGGHAVGLGGAAHVVQEGVINVTGSFVGSEDKHITAGRAI